MSEDITSAFPETITYGALKSTNEEYDSVYWEKLQALYAGGKRLLDSPHFVKIFPPHFAEPPHIYAERIQRSFYINYAGEIIDHIVSALVMHPVNVASEEPHDEFYDGFVRDVSYTGGKRLSLQNLIKQQILTALICRQAWTLVDMPPNIEALGEAIDPTVGLSEAQQVESGLLDAYALPLDPRIVLDWEEAPDGELLWAKTCVLKKERSFDRASALIHAEYTIYRPFDYARYVLVYDEKKPPKDGVPVEKVEEGAHSFERVPLLRLTLPDGLWAMNKLESLCREHLNKRCALSWAEFKSLYPVLYEFLQDEDPETCGEGPGDDKDRAINQTRGIGYVQERAEKDRAEFIGPSAEPFMSALKSLQDLRDEMHRVTHQMALATDNSASSVRRSGDSKEVDRRDSMIILNALGQLAREHVWEIFQTVSQGRQDELTWSVSGLDEYDSIDVPGILNEALMVKNLDIPSPLFKSKYKLELAKAVLGDKVPVAVMQDIEKEIHEAFKDEKPQTAEAKMLEQMQNSAAPTQFKEDPLKGRDKPQQENK